MAFFNEAAMRFHFSHFHLSILNSFYDYFDLWLGFVCFRYQREGSVCPK